jgi:large subunit ribosomal protein L30
MAKIKIKLTRSPIGKPAIQKRTLIALKLTKLNRISEFEETPQILGMINKVKHLIEIIK